LIYDVAKPVSLVCLPREDAEKLILSEGERLDLKLKSLCYAENLQKLYASTKGLPLAIKWAMGQVKQKGQSLDRVLAALGSAQGDIFDDMFAHSWEMLLLTAQQILMVMPIFVVGASRDGIEAVSGLQSSAFDEALGQLVEMSLIARVEEDQLEQQSKQQRFSIHPLTRSFAWAKLKVHPEYPQMYDSARKRLAEFFEGYTGENGGLWNIAGFEQLTFDLPNIIAAIRWCWEQRLAELGTNILDNIRYYIMNHGSWNDALDLSYQAIAFVADLENNDDAVVARDEEWKLRAVRFRVWPIAWIYRFRNELEKAEEQVRQALRVFESLGEDSYIAYSKRHLGLVARDLGRPDDAKQLFQESLRFYQAANDLYRVHLLTADLATLALQDDLDRAYDLSRCVLDDPGQVTDKECIARFYRILGSVEYTRGNLDKARTFCENALAYSEKLKYRDGIADTLVELAEVEQKLGLEQLVHNRLMRAQQIYRELGIDNKVQEIARRLAGWTEESRHVVQ
jgi:tetratricopeptide (TPR) repeat protein